MGVESQHLQKSSVTNGRVAVKDIKKFPVKKIQQKGNFLQEKQKKKNIARKKSISRKLFLYHLQVEIYQK